MRTSVALCTVSPRLRTSLGRRCGSFKPSPAVAAATAKLDAAEKAYNEAVDAAIRGPEPSAPPIQGEAKPAASAPAGTPPQAPSPSTSAAPQGRVSQTELNRLIEARGHARAEVDRYQRALDDAKKNGRPSATPQGLLAGAQRLYDKADAALKAAQAPTDQPNTPAASPSTPIDPRLAAESLRRFLRLKRECAPNIMLPASHEIKQRKQLMMQLEIRQTKNVRYWSTPKIEDAIAARNAAHAANIVRTAEAALKAAQAPAAQPNTPAASPSTPPAAPQPAAPAAPQRGTAAKRLEPCLRAACRLP